MALFVKNISESSVLSETIDDIEKVTGFTCSKLETQQKKEQDSIILKIDGSNSLEGIKLFKFELHSIHKRNNALSFVNIFFF